MSQRWAIIGGGFLGMTLAHRLAQAGHRVTLFEAAPHLGGLASAWSLGDVVWDRHYHVTLSSDRFTRAMLAELGLESEMEWATPRQGFFTDGKFHSVSNAWEFLRFPALNLWQKFRLGLTFLYALRVKDWKRLEAMLVEDWLRKVSGDKVFERIWRPLLRAKLGENYRQTAATFIWATIQRMYSAGGSDMKTTAFGYVPGGYARVLECYAEQLRAEGVELRLSHRAESVEPVANGALRARFANGVEETFDQVVVTTAAPVAAKLCPALTAEEKAKLEAVRYLGVVCASVLLRKPLRGFYVTNITDEWVPLTGLIEMSALVKRECLGGKTLVYLPKYVSADDAGAFRQSEEDVQQTMFGALRKMCPELTEDDLLAFRVSREKYVMALPTLNYSDRLPPMETTVPGLHVVNSAHIVNGTLNVNETLQLAERTASFLRGLPPPTQSRAAGEMVGARVAATPAEAELVSGEFTNG
jgi:protoporphyrinogen oxidase